MYVPTYCIECTYIFSPMFPTVFVLSHSRRYITTLPLTSFIFPRDVICGQIRVEAYDLGVPTALSSDLDLTVFVRDVNDFEPQFLVDSYSVNFTGQCAGKAGSNPSVVG